MDGKESMVEKQGGQNLVPEEEKDEELEKIRTKKLDSMKEKMSGNPGNPEDNYPGEPVVLTEGNFEDFIKKYPLVVVDCWAPWCVPMQNGWSCN